MWSDNETTEDLLGFKVHADLLIDVIKDDLVLPITIGVFGDWGSGKSSILKIIQEEFEREDNNDETLCIYFNGWTFEGYDDAKAALLHSILKGLEDNKKVSAEIKDTIKEKSKKLWKSIDWMRGAGMVLKNVALPAISTYFTGGFGASSFVTQKLAEWGIDTREKLIEKLKTDEGMEFFNSLQKEVPETSSNVNPVSEFRKGFSDLLEATKFKRLVIIIDDLDRCKPESIIENLEAIKLFVNVPKTAFVIGADPRIVRHAIEFKYGKSNDSSRIIDDYLEKLIQLPYSLPKLSEPEVETYISMLICKREIDKEQFDIVHSKFQEFKSKDKYSTYGLSNMREILEASDFDKVKSNIISIPSLVPLITQSLYGNPRQIKRFLNTYILRKRLSNVAKLENFNYGVLAKLMILEYAEIRLFRQLFDWQLHQDGKPKELKELEENCTNNSVADALLKIKDSKSPDWSKEKIIKWLQVEPQLNNIDLRDYFWISRDKVSASISAASLIPPVVKALFNELTVNSEMPATFMKRILNEKYMSLIPYEKESFLNLLSSNLKKNPKDKIGYDLFSKILEINAEKQIPLDEEVIQYYFDGLKVINQKDIPPAVGLSLARFKHDRVMGHLLDDLFKDSDAKAAKSYNLKKNK